LSLQLHHLNGDSTDNRIENLQILCPNCHTQTDNYCGRKLKIKNIIKKCPCCGEEFVATKITQIYCSNECRLKINSKSYASNMTRENIIEKFKELRTWTDTAKEFGVSDKGLIKISKRFGIYDELRSLQKFIMPPKLK
jgi:hypothetical protein